MQQWRILKPPPDDPKAEYDAYRLNSLGSLFFFTGYTLYRNRLGPLHRQICRSLESEDLHLVMELPMGHFKTTIGTEGLPIWWALPFTERDEFLMRQLGYGDAWIRWMRKAHDQNTRTLVAHETDTNATSKGRLIDWHYQENDRFRRLFPEVIPDATCIWNDHSKFQKRTRGLEEGTFEYRGVGSSLQGLHVNSMVGDDLVGKAATDSLLRGDGRVMESIIEYHGLMGTRFDPAAFTKTGIGRHLVIGNRWAHKDLNSWIRANQPEFKFETHSAEGGCCLVHPSGKTIFPEEYTMERLATERNTLGAYRYAHYYLNQSILPEDVVFKPEWLRYYRFKASDENLPLDDPTNFLFIQHETKDGKVIEDMPAGALDLRMIVDPNHAGKRGRCKHAISITGYDSESSRLYLLDEWSESCGYSDFAAMIYKMAYKWGITQPHIETVASQVYLKLYLEELNATQPKKLYFQDLPLDNRSHAKDRRIEALEPYLRNGQFWFHRTHSLAISQITSYYRGKDNDIDLLDTLGFSPQLYNVIRRREVMRGYGARAEEYRQRTNSSTGY